MRTSVCVVVVFLLCSLALPATVAPTSATTAADISVVGGSVTPQSVSTGGSVQITVTVENTGDTTGTKEVRVTASGSQVATRSVTVEAGSKESIATTVSFGIARSYLIRANGVRLGTVDVTEGSTAPETDVIETAAGATVTIDEAQIGQSVTVSLGESVTTNGTGLTGLDLAIGDGTSGFRVEVTPPQDLPPSGIPAISESMESVRSVGYFEATPKGRVPVFNGVTYRFSVSDAELPEGVTPDQVVLLRYDADEGRWSELSTTSIETSIYEAQSPGFSTYAIGFRQQEAEFSISDPSISSSEATLNEEVRVAATISNEGTARGTFTAKLTVGDEVVEEQSVALDPGQSETVAFTLSFDETGAYDIALNGQSVGSVDVVGAQQTELVTEPPKTGTPSSVDQAGLQMAWSSRIPLSLSEQLIVGVGVVGALLGAVYLRRREDDHIDEVSPQETGTTTDPEDRLDTADNLVSDAEAARANGNFETAVETYDEALEEYDTIRETLPADDDRNDEVETAVTAAQAARREVATLATTKEDVEETLAAAERQFLEGIIAHVQGESVLAKTRYRSARSRFEESTELLTDVDAAEVLKAVSVTPETQASLTQLPETLEEFPSVSTEVSEALAENDVTTPADLADSDLDVEEEFADAEAGDDELLAALTALSWWHEPDDEKEWTLEAIERRIDQAGQGRRACL